MATKKTKNEFDVIVVGSGTSGATVAKELSARNKNVLVLERGGDAPLKESFWGAASIYNSISVSENLVTTRALTSGGTSALYFAVADLPPLKKFRELGIDLGGHLEEAKKELPLDTLPDELLGDQAICIRRSAEELGYDWQKKLMLVDQAKCQGGYSYDAKWKARTYLDRAVEQGTVVQHRSRVKKVLVKNNKAVGVEYELQEKGKKTDIHQVFASKVVIAAGALASPIILKRSGIENVVNRGFYCDPCFVVMGTVRGLKGRDNFVGSMTTELDDCISLGDANFSSTFYRLMMLDNRRFLRLFSHSKTVGIGVMVKDRCAGKLDDDNRYYKDLTDDDRQKLDKGEQAAVKIIKNAGGRNIFKSVVSSAHVGGMIQINEHIDSNLKTEIDNLYVCDGSVIPENIRVSPSLTLVCLGKYLAEHLAASL